MSFWHYGCRRTGSSEIEIGDPLLPLGSRLNDFWDFPTFRLFLSVKRLSSVFIQNTIQYRELIWSRVRTPAVPRRSLTGVISGIHFPSMSVGRDGIREGLK